MKKFIVNLFCAVPVLTLLFAVSACTEEPLPGGDGAQVGKNAVTFVVGGGKVETKSAASHALNPQVIGQIRVTDEGDESLFLESSVIGLDDLYYSDHQPVATKGIPNYTENFASLHPSFDAVVYKYSDPSSSVTTPQTFPGSALFDGAASFSKISDSPLSYAYGEVDWNGYDNLLFYLLAVDDDSTLEDAGVGEPVYKYQYATSKSGDAFYNGILEFDYTTPDAAADQKDVLFSSKSLKRGESKSNVLFYHALTGVKFKAGNFGDGFTEINSIELSGIKNTGHCVITPTYDQEGYVWEGHSNNQSGLGTNQSEGSQVTKSSVISYWNPSSLGFSETNDKGVYSLTGLTNDSIHSAASGQFPASFYGQSGQNLGANNFMDEDFENTFFFIPQLTDENVKITIEYTVYQTVYEYDDNSAIGGEKQITRTGKKTLVFSGQDWKAGQLYTYTLTAKTIDVHITDKMDGTEGGDPTHKSDVRIQNTGNAPAYIRAAIIANWVNEFGQVKGQNVWDDKANISGLTTGGWVEGTDGFYYYPYIVDPGQETIGKLFISYNAPVDETVEEGHVVMDIAVQAIDYTKFTKVGTGATFQFGWDASKLTTIKDGEN